MSAPGHSERCAVTTWNNSQLAPAREDFVAREEPLEIRVRGQSVAVTMRSPGHDRELAAGFLLTEGVVRASADLVEIAPCASAPHDARGNIVNVFLSASAQFDPARLTRHVFANSSCGICGKASVEAVHQNFPPVQSSASITAGILLSLPERLRAAQSGFAETGGLHAAALFKLTGELLVSHEDIGRHNAVDKVIGAALLNGVLPLDEAILLVSGRVSFEIAQKALAARIPLIAAVSAPSSLAIELAQDSNQTLVGFLRPPRFNIYTHPGRITP